MLRLTRRSEYGIIALTHLAQRRADAVSSRDIAEHYGIPKRLMAEVMKDLSHCAFVRSVRGASGGYRLSLDPTAVSVLAVLQALEGPFEMVPCTNGAEVAAGSCELLLSCPIKGPIHRIHESINSTLAKVTIDELARGDAFLTNPPSLRAPGPAPAVDAAATT